tara:strand:+ start:162 stop:389 length:228 start_codon:yes stop_codon:yes gene_type:complete
MLLNLDTMKYYWTTKDGKKIDVDDMTESHLRNVLKMILRNQKERIEVEMTEASFSEYTQHRIDEVKFEHEENLWK